MPDPNQETPKLYRMIFGEKAQAAAASSGERLKRWAQAFEDWLIERGRLRRKSAVKESCNNWEEFLALIAKPPWEASAEDVEAFADHQRERGLQDSSICSYLSVLSTFYDYCARQGIDAEFREDAWDFNPVRVARRPKSRDYEKLTYLDREGVEAFLGTLRRDPSLYGKRDYAMFLMMLVMGVQLKDVRELRWRDLEIGSQGGRILRKTRAGDRWEPLPPRFWEALSDYLLSSGRMEKMLPDDYVFAPARAALLKEPSGESQDWNAQKPLSAKQVHYLLKKHAGLAGLQTDRINIYTLRYTAALLHLESGATLAEMREFLGLSSLEAAQKYLLELGRHSRQAVGRAEGGLEPGQEPPERGPSRLKPGTQISLRHGLYLRCQPSAEVEAILAENLTGLEDEIQSLGLLSQRLLDLQDQVGESLSPSRFLEITSQTASRLGTLVDAAESLEAARDPADEMVLEFMQRLDELNLERAEEEGLEGPEAVEVKAAEACLPEASQEKPEGLTLRIAEIRLILRRTFHLAAETDDLKELALLADAYGKAAVRLVRLLKIEARKRSSLAAEFDALINQVLDELMEEWNFI
jgi:integrase